MEVFKKKLGILVRGDLYNKELVGDTWSPIASTRTLKYFLEDAVSHKTKVYQLNFIGEFLQAKVKKMVFLRLERKYADCFPEYSSYFRRALRILKSIQTSFFSKRAAFTITTKYARNSDF